MDLSTLTDAELAAFERQVVDELSRRRMLAEAPGEVDRINRAVLAAEGRGPGGAWVQPTGAHDAYPSGWQASRGGVLYESLAPANVWPPGDPADPQSGRWWRRVGATADPDAWQPWVSYDFGDVVTHGEQRWRCAVTHTSQPDWSPGAPGVYLWTLA